MTESQPITPTFPPMHPVTRLGRIIQQLRSFGDLHADELETMAQSLDAAGAADEAMRLRAYRDVQRDEARMVVDELADIQNDMIAAAQASQPAQPSPVPEAPLPAAAAAIANPRDPAANSPRRARWLAEQAAEAERLRQPVSRRELFGRAVSKPEDNA